MILYSSCLNVSATIFVFGMYTFDKISLTVVVCIAHFLLQVTRTRWGTYGSSVKRQKLLYRSQLEQFYCSPQCLLPTTRFALQVSSFNDQICCSTVATRCLQLQCRLINEGHEVCLMTMPKNKTPQSSSDMKAFVNGASGCGALFSSLQQPC